LASQGISMHALALNFFLNTRSRTELSSAPSRTIN
jgi:hypothetical protein